MGTVAIESHLVDLSSVTLAALRARDDEALTQGVRWLLAKVHCRDDRTGAYKRRTE